MCKLLLVDNEPSFTDGLKELINNEKQDYVVEVAHTFLDAVQSVRGGRFDFAVLDARLGNEAEDDDSGLLLASLIETIKPEMRVIMLSSYKTIRSFMPGRRASNIINFIDKNKDAVRRLLATIDEALSTPHFPYPSALSSVEICLLENLPMTLRSRGAYVASERSMQVTKIDLLRRLANQIGKGMGAWRSNADLLGRVLWQNLFETNNESNKFYGAVTASAKTPSAKAGVVKFVFEGEQDYLQFPFEFLKPPPGTTPFALLHPVSRFIRGITPRHSPVFPNGASLTTTRDTVNVLVVAADTYPPLPGVIDEARTIKALFDTYTDKAYPIVCDLWLPDRVSYEGFRKVLVDGYYDIIHYCGHSAFNERAPDESALYFYEGKNRTGDIVALTADVLNSLLTESSVKMLYLSSCEGTATGSSASHLNDDFYGIAHAAVTAGVPTVLGFRWAVSDQGARLLAKYFYEYFLAYGDPSLALWQARKRVAELMRHDNAWLSPILIHQD